MFFVVNDRDASEKALFRGPSERVSSPVVIQELSEKLAQLLLHLDFSLCREVHRTLSSKACGKM